MPKEHKKRGRRGEKKRKLEQEEDDEQTYKKSKHDDDSLQTDQPVVDYLPLEEGQHEKFAEQAPGSYPQPGEMPFYGMLDDEEQEYFKRADEMLELNDFTDPEDRSTFLANVYKEAEGKELKLANSQSCSRLMERLIQLSTAAQLKSLFHKFSTQ
jgi:nucleolar protein 9